MSWFKECGEIYFLNRIYSWSEPRKIIPLSTSWLGVWRRDWPKLNNYILFYILSLYTLLRVVKIKPHQPWHNDASNKETFEGIFFYQLLILSLRHLVILYDIKYFLRTSSCIYFALHIYQLYTYSNLILTACIVGSHIFWFTLCLHLLPSLTLKLF